ncbi:MAG: CPBP family intramembrane glutamic endopeptidase [Myxococcota bacterium]|jgi:membrane protease YdiL (CAAX protease family)|nr:CPBP family intramembrane glutamic endopeptidase [Myxococcota bacterium]
MRSKLSLPLVIAFYTGLAAISFLIGWYALERNIFLWYRPEYASLPLSVALGAAGGGLVVLLSRLLERWAAWARELSRLLGQMLGQLDHNAIIVLSVFSALGEEALFRGLLQPELGIVWSSLIFGLLHIGPDRRYLSWTMMAIGMGFGFGGLFVLSGNLLAPILAHFTINYFNLHALNKRAE